MGSLSAGIPVWNDCSKRTMSSDPRAGETSLLVELELRQDQVLKDLEALNSRIEEVLSSCLPKPPATSAPAVPSSGFSPVVAATASVEVPVPHS